MGSVHPLGGGGVLQSLNMALLRYLFIVFLENFNINDWNKFVTGNGDLWRSTAFQSLVDDTYNM